MLCRHWRHLEAVKPVRHQARWAGRRADAAVELMELYDEGVPCSLRFIACGSSDLPEDRPPRDGGERIRSQAGR
jgi:hypothetical protein